MSSDAPLAPPPSASTPAPPRRPASRSGGRCVLVLGVVLIGLALLVAVLALSGGAFGTGSVYTGLEEEVVRRPAAGTEGTIALLHVSGVITGTGSHLNGSEAVFALGGQLRRAAEDDAVKAVVLQVDSPGGGLQASDLLHHEVTRFRASGKPLVVLVGDLAASGGYYLSAPADCIIAGPTSLVGSIGVIMPRFEVHGLLDKLGVRATPIKSAARKDLGSPFHELTPEEQAFFKGLLDHYHARFVRIVAEGRGLEEEAVRALATGEVYTAEEALERGLVDEIGYIDDAMAKARELAGLDKGPRVIRYQRPLDFRHLFRSETPASLGGLWHEVERTALAAAVPRALALWTGAAGR